MMEAVDVERRLACGVDDLAVRANKVGVIADVFWVDVQAEHVIPLGTPFAVHPFDFVAIWTFALAYNFVRT